MQYGDDECGQGDQNECGREIECQAEQEDQDEHSSGTQQQTDKLKADMSVKVLNTPD